MSDVIGFVISFIAVCISQKKSTDNMSYGYHRADVLGALGSIFLIWGLLIWLLVEAIDRIQNPEEIDGEVMLITACIGLACNILNLIVLHYCGNDDAEADALNLKSSVVSAYLPYARHSLKGSNDAPKSSEKKRSNSDHNVKKHSVISFQTSELESSQQIARNPTSDQITPTESYPLEKKLTLRSESTEPKSVKQDGQKTNASPDKRKRSQFASKSMAGDANRGEFLVDLEDKWDNDVEEAPVEAEIVEQADKKSSVSQNLNVRAAVIHLLGDLVQSIGVIIAALIIFFKPEWTLADPICTFLFSILVMLTTVPIFKDCIAILMETSSEVDSKNLRSSLAKVRLFF